MGDQACAGNTPACRGTEADPDFLLRCVTQHPRVRFSFKENRMKSTDATHLDRKSGGATCPGLPWKWRDLRFPCPLLDASKGRSIKGRGKITAATFSATSL